MKKIAVKNVNGNIEEVDLIKAFEITDISKKFVILSKNETNSEGLCKVYVSEVIETSPGIYELIGILDDALWDRVKKAMKEMVES